MRQLTIDVEDHIHTALEGWKMIDASICDLHGAAGVPYFLKQLGGWPNKQGGEQALLDGRLHQEIPA